MSTPNINVNRGKVFGYVGGSEVIRVRPTCSSPLGGLNLILNVRSRVFFSQSLAANTWDDSYQDVQISELHCYPHMGQQIRLHEEILDTYIPCPGPCSFLSKVLHVNGAQNLNLILLNLRVFRGMRSHRPQIYMSTTLLS